MAPRAGAQLLTGRTSDPPAVALRSAEPAPRRPVRISREISLGLVRSVRRSRDSLVIRRVRSFVGFVRRQQNERLERSDTVQASDTRDRGRGATPINHRSVSTVTVNSDSASTKNSLLTEPFVRTLTTRIFVIFGYRKSGAPFFPESTSVSAEIRDDQKRICELERSNVATVYH